jgi:uncharacterized protein
VNIFLDTSSLVKLYHKEMGTEEIQSLFLNKTITKVFLAGITKIEFSSVELGRKVIDEAQVLMAKYGLLGARTLDILQLSTATLLSEQVDLFLTADKLLKSFFEAENLSTQIPNNQ